MMKRLIINTTIVMISVLLSIVVLLFFDFIYSNYFSNNIHVVEYKVAKDHGWYELKKSHNGPALWGDHMYEINTDEYGFRVSGVDSNNKKAKYIFLGDSFTFGVNGSWDETFVGMFDSSTNDAVLNAGVPSYSPTGYLYRYKQALKLNLLEKDHIVILGLDISDVQDESSYWRDSVEHPVNIRREGQNKPSAKYLNANDKFKKFRRKNFKMTRKISRFIREYFRELRGWDNSKSAKKALNTHRSAFTWKEWSFLNKQSNNPFSDHSSFYPLGVQGGLDRVRHKLSLISKLSNENNSSLYILIYPWPAQIYYNQKFNWSDYVNKLCKEITCSGVIDAQHNFTEYANNNNSWYKDLFIFGDTHYNISGNALIFDSLSKTFLKQ